MTQTEKPSPAAIRRARADNPKARERDIAKQLGITEADLVAAHCGSGVRRVRADVDAFLTGAPELGEVMALTRNESAVHEKIGVYEKPVLGKHASMVLGSEIDLRIFPGRWAHGFAVEKGEGAEIRRSLQFFDAAGEAVHGAAQEAAEVPSPQGRVRCEHAEPVADTGGHDEVNRPREVGEDEENQFVWKNFKGPASHRPARATDHECQGKSPPVEPARLGDK